MILLIQLSY